MGLLITKNVTLLDEVNTSRLYIRLEAKVEYGGSKISVQSRNYLSKNSFTMDNYNNSIKIKELPSILVFDYNRNVDGADILEFAHEKFKQWISEDKTKEIVTRDPSTGARMFDASTGELIMNTIIISPKYADFDDIEIDID